MSSDPSEKFVFANEILSAFGLFFAKAATLVERTALDPNIFGFHYAEAQAPVVLMLDLYILVLPLPAIAVLKMSVRKRIRVIAVFGTAAL